MTASFYDEVIKQSPQFNSVERVDSLDLLEPVTREAIKSLIADAASHGTKLMVFETYRSEARQQALFEQGATQLRMVGVHHFGLAADVVKEINGEPSWKGPFDFMAVLALRYKLIWGGTFKGFVDSSHLQRIALHDQARLFAGDWYPVPSYSPYALLR